MTDHREPDDGPLDDPRRDDVLLDALAALDPTTADSPPAPGSTRRLSILEHAMTRTTHLAPTDDPTSGDDRGTPRRRSRRPVFALAAAAVAAVVLGIVVVAPGSDPTPASAAEALAQAAETTGEATTLRVEATSEDTYSTSRVTAEVNGTDYRIEGTGTYADGHEERGTTVVIGNTVWEDGAKRIAPPEERNAAYAPSSEAVVKAIIDGSTLEDLGDEDVRGVSARHIRATLTPTSRAALSALSPSQVGMFELEYPDEVDTLDLWIADDLIRRIRVAVNEGTGPDGKPQVNATNTEFYDFGADITITAPS